MYMPKHFEERDVGVLHELIRAHPFGTWVTLAGGELLVNHMPFLVDPSPGEFGMLVGHVARPNPAWKAFSKEMASVVIFQGPQGYITPSWYPTKGATGKVVPTWNYAVVHAHGALRVIEDRAWLRDFVTALTNRYEATRRDPWQVTDAPADYIDKQLGAIVGLELSITRLVGKWKMSQNRPAQDRAGVVEGLGREGGEAGRVIADLVRGSGDPAGGA